MTVPDSLQGFEEFTGDGSFSDVLRPMYMKYDDNGPQFAIQVNKNHLNPLGICHGGVYMTFMDFALCAALCHKIGKFTGTPTINLAMDFLSSAKEGEIICADCEVLKVTNTMAFVQGVVRTDAGPVARANGSFKLPKSIADAPGITVNELAQMRDA